MDQGRANSAPFPVNTMLDAKYRIDRLLEVGGMGAVYVGTHVQLQKRVAIKVLRSEFASATEFVSRFQREAIAASKIGHENIIQVTDIGYAFNGSPFIVMEYLDGEDLAGRIKRAGKMLAGEACAICLEILSGIDAAHQQGIVHRDMKPENVFLVPSRRGVTVKVLDFGISRMTATEDPDHRLTATGVVIGTPYYMSPEQACGESDISVAADIYAVGVILYEMLTAKVPFNGTNYNSLIYNVISGDFPPPSAHVAVAPELEAIVLKAMSQQAAHRYSSAQEFAAALTPFAPVSSGISLSGSSLPVVQLASQEAFAPTLADTSPDAGAAPARFTPRPAQAGPLSGAVTAPQRPAGMVSADAAASPAPSGGRGRLLWVSLAVLALAGGTVAAFIAAQSRGERLRGDAQLTATTDAAPGSQETAKVLAGGGGNVAAGAQLASDAAPPPAVPAVSPITITIRTTPPDAAITVDGDALAGNELTRNPSDEEVVIAVARPGFQTKERRIALDRDRDIEVILTKDTVETNRRKKPRQSADPARDKTTKPRRIITDSPYD